LLPPFPDPFFLLIAAAACGVLLTDGVAADRVCIEGLVWRCV